MVATDFNKDGFVTEEEVHFDPIEGKRKAPTLGVIRLDYNYPTSPGDIDDPRTYRYDVVFRVVPGLTFEMCQSGKMNEDVEKEFIAAVKWLTMQGVKAITGDCGFMMWFQELARYHTYLPVFMSALSQLPAVTAAFNDDEEIIIMTANSKTLTPMKELIHKSCGVDLDKTRFKICGAENVEGFEAVARGEKVDRLKVEPGIVKLAQEFWMKHRSA